LRLTPEVSCATLEAGWPHAQVLAHSRHATGARDPEPVDEGAVPTTGLGGLIEATLTELSHGRSLKGARLDVELADALVHLDVASGDFSAESDAVLAAVARACIAELLGDAIKDHVVRWQLQADARHLLICAVDQSLLQSLDKLAARHGLRLRSVQPDFCVQWNRHVDKLRTATGVFAVAHGNDAVIAHADRGTVRALSVGPWLDRIDPPGTSNPQAMRLLCELGLAPLSTAGVLDQRVDRLLASVGACADAQGAFVLVAPASSAKAVTRRWIVFEREAEPA
jgi:hypothetical protein